MSNPQASCVWSSKSSRRLEALTFSKVALSCDRREPAFLQAVGGDSLLELQVGDVEVVGGGIAGEQPGIGFASEPAGVLSRPGDHAVVEDVQGELDGSGDAIDGWLQVPDDAADVRVPVGELRRGVFPVHGDVRDAGEHLVAAGGVGVVVGGDGAEDGGLVGVCGGEGHEFADVDAGNCRGDGAELAADFLGSVRFGIPGFVLAGAAEQADHDDRLRPAG